MEKQAFKRIPVESSNIKYIGHSYPRRLLEVGFNNGSVYRYKNVNNKVYKELLRADSKGKAFHALVKGKYPYKQIVDKDGDKVKKEWNKVSMRNFDEFVKTAGIIGNLTGKTVRDAEAKLGRAINRANKMEDIVNIRHSNTGAAEKAKKTALRRALNSNKEYRTAKKGKDAAFNNIGKGWNDVKESSNWKDRLKNVAAMPKKVLVDPTVAEVKTGIAKNKYNHAEKNLNSALDNLSKAKSKESKSGEILDKMNNSVNEAVKGLKNAKIKTNVTRGLVGAGLIAGAAYGGKKLYDKKKPKTSLPENQNTENMVQYQDIQYQQPQYQGMM